MNEVWNLDPIYKGFDDPAFEADLARGKEKMAEFAAFTIKVPSLFCGLCMPGVSRKTYCVSSFVSIPVIFVRVVCGLFDTIETFSPRMLFISVDLPTLGRPIRAANNVFVIFILSSARLKRARPPVF